MGRVVMSTMPIPPKAIERRFVNIEEVKHRFPVGSFVSITLGVSTYYAKVVDIRIGFCETNSQHEPISSDVILQVKEYSVCGFKEYNTDISFGEAVIASVTPEDMIRYFNDFVSNEIFSSEANIAKHQNDIANERRHIRRLKERAKLLDKELI